MSSIPAAAEPRLKIAVSCYPSPGGSGVVATELALSLAEQGHEVHFVVADIPLRFRRVTTNVFTHKVETVSYPLFEELPYTLSLAAKMAEVVDCYGIDLIHAHYALPHAASAYLARQMLAPKQVRLITTLHGTDITLVGMHPSLYRVTRFCIEASDGVTAVSAYLKRRTEEIFRPRAEVRVIPNFVDTQRFRPSAERTPGAPPVIMHASNFRPVKRVETVVRVFHGISRAIPEACLLLVGDGPERGKAEDLTYDLGLDRQVHFLGSTPSIEELLAQADLFLLPSEFESFGLTALEAMSAGACVMVTGEGGASELVTHGQDGFLFHPNDVGGMIETGISLLRDPAAARRVGEAARATALERFDTARVIPQYLELYRRVMEA